MNIYQVLALTLVTIFYLSYFLKQILLKKQGIQTNLLAKGNKPKRTFLIEVFLLITTYLMALAQYISIIFEKYFYNIFTFPSIRIVGVIASFIGVCFFICAIVTMKDSWRAGVDKNQETKIITKGIYSISRNPAFVGFDLLYIGTTLAFSNIILIILTLCTVIILHLQILEEEKFLPSVFGEEYLEYKKKTKRYFIFF